MDSLRHYSIEGAGKCYRFIAQKLKTIGSNLNLCYQSLGISRFFNCYEKKTIS
jgi:hypothetical protein